MDEADLTEIIRGRCANIDVSIMITRGGKAGEGEGSVQISEIIAPVFDNRLNL